MRTRIKDLDFDRVIAKVLNATDVKRQIGCDELINGALKREKTHADRVNMLSNYIALAAVRNADGPEDVRFEQPLAQALVRAQHHPAAAPLPAIEYANGADATVRLAELVDAHPELAWDADAVQELLIQALKENGDHELDDAIAPWRMHWGRTRAAAHTFFMFLTLRAFGEFDIDEWQKGAYQEAMEHSEQMRGVRPSPLVEGPPPKKRKS